MVNAWQLHGNCYVLYMYGNGGNACVCMLCKAVVVVSAVCCSFCSSSSRFFASWWFRMASVPPLKNPEAQTLRMSRSRRATPVQFLSQPHGNCSATPARAAVDRPKTAWQLHGKFIANAWQMHCKCIATVWQLHANCMPTALQLYSNCIANAWLMHNKCIANALQ